MAARDGPALAVLLALLATGLVVVTTLGNRGVVVSHEGLGHDLTWWTRNWSRVPTQIQSGLDWWLNVVLFVPAGWAWTRLTHRPRAVMLALGVTIVTIETLHAAVLSGAGDVGDLVANELGAAIGATAGTFELRRRSPPDVSSAMHAAPG